MIDNEQVAALVARQMALLKDKRFIVVLDASEIMVVVNQLQVALGVAGNDEELTEISRFVIQRMIEGIEPHSTEFADFLRLGN